MLACSTEIPPSQATEPTAAPAAIQAAVPTPTPSAVPTAPPTATPTTEPTHTPAPPTRVLGDDPADYTDEDILLAAKALYREFIDAIMTEPEPDLKRAKAIYSEACQPDDDDVFAKQVDAVMELLGDPVTKLDITMALRLRDDAALTVSTLKIGDGPGGVTRSLIVFENGRWLDSDCDAGRAAAGVFPYDEDYQESAVAGPSPVPAPVTLSADPADHSDEEIARSVEALHRAGWRAMLAQPQPDLDGMRAMSIEECRVETDEELIQIAASSKPESEIADAAINFRVTGVERVDDRHAWTTILTELEGFVIPGSTMSLVVFEDGQWRDGQCKMERGANLAAPDEIKEIQRVAFIGETGQLQFDWEEPPFAITVLAPPEAADGSTVRVPARFTSIISRWRYGPYSLLAELHTARGEDGTVISWLDSPCEEGPFDDVILVKGGSHEGFICFEGERGESAPDRPFVGLQYLDEGSDWPFRVDLTRSVPIPERVLFEDGKPSGNATVAGIGYRLVDSLWSHVVEPPPAGIGDSVTVTNHGQPWFDLTVLGQPEMVGEAVARVRIRIASRAEDEEEYGYVPLELSTGPDAHGRIHHLWDFTSFAEGGAALTDSFTGVTLAKGEVREAYAYFRAPDGEAGAPPTPFTTLWYWHDVSAFPIDLTRAE